jgi:hydrogenase expression/formation protein HypC
MCLAIPGKIIEFTDALDDVFRIAKVDYGGVQKEVNMSMLPEAKVGDYVMVHVGVAISIVDEEEAHETAKFLRQMGEFDEDFEESNE